MSRTNKYCITSEELIKAIKGEMEAKSFYERLITKTSDTESIKIIKGIIKDEETHQAEFRKLYKALFKMDPAVPPSGSEIPIESFFDGLSTAIMDELSAYEFYRDIIMKCSESKVVSMLFFKAMTDENEHAMLENFMMNKVNHR